MDKLLSSPASMTLIVASLWFLDILSLNQCALMYAVEACVKSLTLPPLARAARLKAADR
jgi:hypothetical protein